MLVKNHHKGLFDTTYFYNHWIAEIINDSKFFLTTPDGKEKKFNIYHMKPVSSLELYVGLQAEVPIGVLLPISGQYQAESQKYQHQWLSAFVQPEVKT